MKSKSFENKSNITVPFLTVVSNNFEKDLGIMKRALSKLEKRTHSENDYKRSDRAQLDGSFYDVLSVMSCITEHTHTKDERLNSADN